MEENKKKYHRGRRKRKKKAKKQVNLISNIILILAIAVFCFSGFQLFSIFKGYRDGKGEYDELADQAISIENENGEEKFVVDFAALKAMNPDVVGWIRFEEPAIINYPIVQGVDNDEYLYKTFQGYDNTVGTIFVNVYNNPDFEDQNTIVYGHRMNNETMFNKLAEYREESFWKKHPYFYIYTPDGSEMKYHIYSVGEVHEEAELYAHLNGDDAAFQSFIDESMSYSFYNTGIDVTTDDKVVMLSTCIRGKDTYRLVVFGVRAEVKQ